VGRELGSLVSDSKVKLAFQFIPGSSYVFNPTGSAWRGLCHSGGPAFLRNDINSRVRMCKYFTCVSLISLVDIQLGRKNSLSINLL
jgi:hypothetical protein